MSKSVVLLHSGGPGDASDRTEDQLCSDEVWVCQEEAGYHYRVEAANYFCLFTWLACAYARRILEPLNVKKKKKKRKQLKTLQKNKINLWGLPQEIHHGVTLNDPIIQHRGTTPLQVWPPAIPSIAMGRGHKSPVEAVGLSTLPARSCSWWDLCQTAFGRSKGFNWHLQKQQLSGLSTFGELPYCLRQ